MVRPPLPISQPAVAVSTISFAFVRKLFVGSRPPNWSCSLGGSPTSGIPMPPPEARDAAAVSGRYLKSLGWSLPRSAISWMTRWMDAAAATTWAAVPSMPTGVSAMPMTFSLPMLSSAPEAAITSWMVAPRAPTMTGTAAAGMRSTKKPRSVSMCRSCIFRSLRMMPLHAASFCSACPLMVTMRSLRRFGVSRSLDESIAAPVRTESSRRMALLL
mmetsp:Transcript_66193/g.194153  ORF Transcript_66193/g.194153 Transcript_66193/m.194153 type:complete len:215 (+) Transcript_66193:262-906(+)